VSPGIKDLMRGVDLVVFEKRKEDISVKKAEEDAKGLDLGSCA